MSRTRSVETIKCDQCGADLDGKYRLVVDSVPDRRAGSIDYGMGEQCYLGKLNLDLCDLDCLRIWVAESSKTHFAVPQANHPGKNL